jgi:phospholipid/cholesterol/gamma-HCH transport system substrate-binding protein
MSGLRKRAADAGRTRLSILAALVVVLTATGWSMRPGNGQIDVVAYVESSNGIYAGDEVRVLGVPVGRIDEITPERNRVRVEFHFDEDVKVPADAKAAVVAPSLVSSRYLQLAPRYDGGPTMGDGDRIPLERTATPVEWDEIKGQLDDLAVALGPRGANRDGALSRLLDTTAGTLDGKGASINTTIHNLASAVRTLQSGSGDTFSTVRKLQVFVSALVQSDDQVASFLERLDAVSGMFAENKRALRTALGSLSTAVDQVGAFVRGNRGEVLRTLKGLSEVSRVVARQQDDLAQALHVAPNALANLIESYHQRQNAVGVDLHGANIHSPGQLVCGAVGGAAGTSGAATDRLCQQTVGDLLDRLANAPGAAQTVDFITEFLGVLW